MGNLPVSTLAQPEPGLDKLRGGWHVWLAGYGRLLRRASGVGRLAAWLGVTVALAALAFSAAARDLVAQMLWSLYLLWQFLILARSKSVTWRTCGGFFAAGALLSAPLAVLSAVLVHWLVGGTPDEPWSAVGWAAFSEEVLKLLPLAVFAVGTRRARSLGLADHALLGAATGAGFQFAEEALRRLLSLAGSAGAGDAATRWAVLSLFPGSFAPGAGRTMAGHAVLTGLAALGIGIARRYQRPQRRGIWVLPTLLLLLAIVDHAAYNGRDSLPLWALEAHDALGAGLVAAPLLLTLLVTAVAIDYRDLNRLGDRLPRLLPERRMGPLQEARLLLAVAPAGLPGVSNLLALLHERRRLGHGLVHLRSMAEPDPVEVPVRLGWHRQRLGALLAGSAGLGLLLALPVVPLTAAVDRGAVAALLHALGASWEHLATREQIGALAVLPALVACALGRWTAALLDTGAPIAGRIPPDATGSRPGARWLPSSTPGAALARGIGMLLDRGLRRIPGSELSRRLATVTFRHPARVDVYRLFRGRIDSQGRVLGLHHRGSIGSQRNARPVPGTVTPPDANGVYQAAVTLRDPASGEWVRSLAPSSFFPDDWSRARVLQEIRAALEHARFEGLRWEGAGPSGVRVYGSVDADGTIRAAYPVWEGTRGADSR